MPLGLDICEPPMLFALQEEGIDVRDGQQMMLHAREIKSHDEITLLNIASSMVDGVYQDIATALKPGVKESQIVALATKRLYEMGSDCVEAINSISGERCSPHPHNFTDRLIRPGDPAYFDIIHSFIGYRTCYYRTFTVGSSTQSQRDAYKQARQWMDDAIEMLKPGLSTDKAAKQLPKASDIGFESEMAAFGLNFCHGLGLGLHERPLISRLNSFIEPYELKAGMVFAVETFCPANRRLSPPHASKRWSFSLPREQKSSRCIRQRNCQSRTSTETGPIGAKFIAFGPFGTHTDGLTLDFTEAHFGRNPDFRWRIHRKRPAPLQAAGSTGRHHQRGEETLFLSEAWRKEAPEE